MGNTGAGRRAGSSATLLAAAPPPRTARRRERRSVGLDQAGADGAHPGVQIGHEELPVGQSSKASRTGLHRTLVGGHAADEGDGRLDDLALGDRALEVADDGVAQALEHLGRLVALLLGVDHVGLGEHAAAPGDVGRPPGGDDDAADVLDLVQQAAGLLVDERARAGRAVAVGLVVGDAGAARGAVGVEAQELGGLAAHLEDGDDVGMQPGQAAGDGLELVLVGRVERLADEASARAGDAHAAHGVAGTTAKSSSSRAAVASLGLPLMRR